MNKKSRDLPEKSSPPPRREPREPRRVLAGWRRLPLLLYGLVIGAAGVLLYVGLSVGAALSLLLPATWTRSAPFAVTAIAASALVLLGGLFVLVDLFALLPGKMGRHEVRVEPPHNTTVTVALTAYNDEDSIGQAVQDFRAHPAVRRVVVVDNASRDHTAQVASDAGAIVIREGTPGYGNCVWRALHEASRYEDTELILLCEGDCTFRAFDIDKFLAYAAHADIVNGTRIVEQLRSPHTQLTTFMYYGNFFVGKMLEAKHLGAGTFTDVGTTYKLCRKAAIEKLLPLLNRQVNLEFNAHLLDQALGGGLAVVECPITFFPRVGQSKGGNTDNWRASAVGLRMIRGLLFGWPAAKG